MMNNLVKPSTVQFSGGWREKLQKRAGLVAAAIVGAPLIAGGAYVYPYLNPKQCGEDSFSVTRTEGQISASDCNGKIAWLEDDREGRVQGKFAFVRKNIPNMDVIEHSPDKIEFTYGNKRVILKRYEDPDYGSPDTFSYSRKRPADSN